MNSTSIFHIDVLFVSSTILAVITITIIPAVGKEPDDIEVAYNAYQPNPIEIKVGQILHWKDNSGFTTQPVIINSVSKNISYYKLKFTTIEGNENRPSSFKISSDSNYSDPYNKQHIQNPSMDVRSDAAVTMTEQQNNSVKNKDFMNVELNIFSGNPNPEWNLSTNQVSELLTKISSLNYTERSPVDKGLGYNGFTILRTEKSADSQWPKRIEIKDGIIYVYYDNDRYAHLIDPERTIELWLLNTAPNSVSSMLLKKIENDIKGAKAD
jgi:hypothetical protein